MSTSDWTDQTLGVEEAAALEAELAELAAAVAAAECLLTPDRYAEPLLRADELAERLAAAHPAVASHCPDPFRECTVPLPCETTVTRLTGDSRVRHVLFHLQHQASELRRADRHARMRPLSEAEFRDAMALVCSARRGSQEDTPLAVLVAEAALSIDEAKRRLGVVGYRPLTPQREASPRASEQ